jgi:FixJ family two-component response regulator
MRIRPPWRCAGIRRNGLHHRSGRPDLFRELRRRNVKIPVVFITARRDDAAQSQLLNDGAVECLFKPFDDTALLNALNKAVDGKLMFLRSNWSLQ